MFQLQFVSVEFSGVLDLWFQDLSQFSGGCVIDCGIEDSDQVILSADSLGEFFLRSNERLDHLCHPFDLFVHLVLVAGVLLVTHARRWAIQWRRWSVGHSDILSGDKEAGL